MFKFNKNTSVLTIILLVLGYILFNFVKPEEYNTAYPYIFIFLLLQTIAVHYILTTKTKNSTLGFNNIFMISTFSKFFINIIVIAVYIYFNTETAIKFAAFYLILYFIFTSFEIYSILKYLKQKN